MSRYSRKKACYALHWRKKGYGSWEYLCDFPVVVDHALQKSIRFKAVTNKKTNWCSGIERWGEIRRSGPKQIMAVLQLQGTHYLTPLLPKWCRYVEEDIIVRWGIQLCFFGLTIHVTLLHESCIFFIFFVIRRKLWMMKLIKLRQSIIHVTLLHESCIFFIFFVIRRKLWTMKLIKLRQSIMLGKSP